MDRRQFLGISTLGLLGSFASLPKPGKAEESRTMTPNILLILSDDQPFYTMPYMSKTVAQFASGLEFTRAYITSCVCSPSRSTIHTGCYVHTHNVALNKGAARKFRRGGWANASIGSILRAAGYECGYFGKWMNGYEDMASWRAPGYNDWAAVLANRDPIWANVDGRVKLPRWNTGNRVARKNETQWLGEKALTFIEKAEEPWFCFASIKAPHSPYDPSNAHAGDFSSEPFPVPGRLNFDAHDPLKPKTVRDNPPLSNDKISHYRNIYRLKLEEMMDLDDQVDALCDAVDFEDTYVFYLSDNGFFLGEHRLYSKGLAYEEAARTPMLIRGPGMMQGAVSDALVANVDLAPTILELAGIDPVEEGMDGRSMIGSMVGPPTEIEGEEESPEIETRDYLLLEMPNPHGVGGWYALRTDTALYVEHITGEREYYDMDPASSSYDPFQLSNTYAEMDTTTRDELHDKISKMRDAEGQELRDQELREPSEVEIS